MRSILTYNVPKGVNEMAGIPVNYSQVTHLTIKSHNRSKHAKPYYEVYVHYKCGDKAKICGTFDKKFAQEMKTNFEKEKNDERIETSK